MVRTILFRKYLRDLRFPRRWRENSWFYELFRKTLLTPWKWGVGGSTIHRNVGIQSPHYTAQQPRKQQILCKY